MAANNKVKVKKPQRAQSTNLGAAAPIGNQPPLASLRVRRQRVQAIVKLFHKANPSPHCELYYKTPYQLLLSVVLSAQATDKSVNKCMQPCYDTGLDPDLVLRWGRDTLLAKIKTIGLAPTKSKNILALTKILLERYDGQVPHDRAALESLPGVGRKSASVVLGEIFHEPTLAVDTHVLRVTRRLGLHAETTPVGAERVLLTLFDAKVLPRAHHWLVLHGRYVCKAPKPLCSACLLQTLCPYFLHLEG